ncbi:hypothetical protein KHS38_09695 [Mucilaginibacter sp. Bleaf8]|uniref:hypothetical protein n=1 Tax=Mucilaginibacter sp. Bleaf8 TaxID=2834430 RepID=UPI001BCB9192|nr:hypothetical protein [Mucilaginibacter sp. Bleaf8]MBS7564676.1 hypothetical protein [Mucilaginibacter sp. Bleaf8]
MNQIQLFLNDHLVDLSDDNPIALSFQINNLAEVKNQQGNTSNQFKLPLTQRNRQILGFPDEVAFTTNDPYKQYKAKIVQDGLEIIPFGVAELNGVEQDMASITVLSGNVDFFDAIDGKLYDMGDSTTTWGVRKPWFIYAHEWSLYNVAQSQTKTSGWIWPVIDYGNLKYDERNTPEINVKNLRPGFFLKTAVEMITRNAGFKPTGSLLQDELYNKLIVQFANDNFEHGTDQQSLREYNSISLSNSMKFKAGRGLGYADRFPLNTVNPYPVHNNSYPNDTFKPATNEYVALQNCSVSVSFTYDVSIDSKEKPRKGGGIEIRLKTRDPRSGAHSILTTLTTSLTDKATDGHGQYTEDLRNQKLTYDIDLVKNQTLYIEYNVNNSSNTYVYIAAGAIFSVTSKTKNMLYGQQVQCERIFPDIGQKDLLKDTLQRFGIICQTNNETRKVNFAFFSEIIKNISQAVDWTSKCLDQGKSISFKLGNYAQINYLKHKEDDSIIPKTLGQSQILVNDKTLPATADLFESQFAPSLNRPFIGGTIALIKKVDADADENDFSLGTQPRLLVDQKLSLNQKSVKFVDDDGKSIVVNDYVSVPYFYKPDGEHNLCWADMPSNGTENIKGLKSRYYTDLEHILKQSKKIVRWFLLTPRDILELNLLIPVYLQQDGAYYYINKIDSWRKGQPTKVELVKLG